MELQNEMAESRYDPNKGDTKTILNLFRIFN